MKNINCFSGLLGILFDALSPQRLHRNFIFTGKGFLRTFVDVIIFDFGTEAPELVLLCFILLCRLLLSLPFLLLLLAPLLCFLSHHLLPLALVCVYLLMD